LAAISLQGIAEGAMADCSSADSYSFQSLEELKGLLKVTKRNLRELENAVRGLQYAEIRDRFPVVQVPGYEINQIDLERYRRLEERRARLLKAIEQKNAPGTAEEPIPRPAPRSDTEAARKRGRPQTIPDKRKAAALMRIKEGGTLRDAAVELYDNKRPTTQQVKNASTLLRVYRKALEKAGLAESERTQPRETDKNRG
jgi:hypothetical protein